MDVSRAHPQIQNEEHGEKEGEAISCTIMGCYLLLRGGVLEVE